MKHHCHCGLERHWERLRLKRFGIFGMTLMVLHVLLHIVECLVVPAVLVALGGQATHEDAAAVSESAEIVPAAGAKLPVNTPGLLVDFDQSLQILRLEL